MIMVNQSSSELGSSTAIFRVVLLGKGESRLSV
jgi:hypothetical protein